VFNINSNQTASDYIDNFSIVFWDFDGVIKDSVDIKTQAYEHLFLSYGDKVSKWVRRHHEANGGMSRFEKIPLYLRQAGIRDDSVTVDIFCSKFSNLVVQKVIDSPWVPGVVDYLSRKGQSTIFVLVTATPTREIEEIADRINISRCFEKVFGAPYDKADVIADVMKTYSLNSDDALMIGDAKADLVAADKNSIRFLLRRTPINLDLQKSYMGPQFEDFSNE
jgi:phosphoglycolate phosphatase-like HAD superfamily hydrolase